MKQAKDECSAADLERGYSTTQNPKEVLMKEKMRDMEAKMTQNDEGFLRRNDYFSRN